MASFAVGDYKLSGLMLGYGLIASEDIDEGLHRLKTSFEEG